MKSLKIYNSTLIFLTLLGISCTTKIAQSSNYEIKVEAVKTNILTDTEIKFIYHEALRHVLYTKKQNSIASLFLLEEYYRYREAEDSTNKNFEFLIADQNRNWIFNEYYSTKITDSSKLVSTSQMIKKMDFNLNVKIQNATIKDTLFKIDVPIVGYFLFSDLLFHDQNTYYLGVSFIYKLINKDKVDLDSGCSYIFEIKKCNSGFIFFNSIIEPPGQLRVSAGHGILKTITPLNAGYECSD